jgi:hypothetical protein
MADMDASVDEGRDQQFKLWSTWSPAQRLRVMGRMTATVLALRNDRLQREMPHATPDEIRQARIQATLASSPSHVW